MLDPTQCYRSYLHVTIANAPSDALPRQNGTKRRLEAEVDDVSMDETQADHATVHTLPIPDIAPVFLQSDVAPIRLPDSIATASATPVQSAFVTNVGWPHEHAGLLSEEGGAKMYTESCT